MKLLNALGGMTDAARLPRVLAGRVTTPRRPLRTRAIAAFMAMVMVWTFKGSPLYSAWRGPAARERDPARIPADGQVDSIRFDDLVTEARDLLRSVQSQVARAPRSKLGQVERLKELRDAFTGENLKVERHFAEVDSLVASRDLPGEIRARQQSLARGYRAKYVRLRAELDAVLATWESSSPSTMELDRALGFLEENAPRSPRSRLDPKHLPFRSLRVERPVEPGTGFAARAAAAPDGSGAGAGDEPTPEDFNETVEVQFTPEIRKLADDLGRSPVRIMNWVRNNIEFVPTWGSIQGAQLCLETHRGNSFDTASLLIALLRVSGIAARYQMGTIEVPAAELMNWAGGFENVDAAASFVASAGTPCVVRRADAAGEVQSVRLDHVWVRAFVDYIPSRGATQCGPGDTWVEMDAGYKQYEFTKPLDIEAAIPSGFQALVDELGSKAVVDPVTGSVTGIDTQAMEQWARRTLEERRAFLTGQQPEPLVSQIVGARRIVRQDLPILSIAPPYGVLRRESALAAVPESLRHRFTLELGTSEGSADLLRLSASLAELGTKDILVLYRPASEMEGKLVADLLAAGAALPSSIRVTPQLNVADEIVTGPPIGIGSRVHIRYAFESPTVSTPPVLNEMAAGEAAAVGLDLQGVPAAKLQGLMKKADDLRQALQGPDPRADGADFARSVLSANVMSWFAMVDAQTELASRVSGVAMARYPSAGMFSFKLRVSSAFGAAVSASSDGMGMDIDRDIVISEARDGDREKSATLSFRLGTLGSSMEAEIPIGLLATQDGPVRGVSTMHALRLANDQGIPVHRIDGTNASSVLERLAYSAEDLEQVRAAVSFGLEVRIPERPVEFEGQKLVAMVVHDASTGSASFLIGGSNGALVLAAVAAALTAAVLVGVGLVLGAAVAIPFLTGVLLAVASGLSLAAVVTTIFDPNGLGQFVDLCVLNAFVLYLVIGLLLMAMIPIALGPVVIFLAFLLLAIAMELLFDTGAACRSV